MAKPVLGRGLGNLMKDAQTAPPPVGPISEQNPSPLTPTPTGAEPPRLSPGMATLLRGTQPEADPNVKPAPNAVPNIGPHTTDLPDRRTPRTLRVSLVIADVLLLALVIRLVTKTPGRLGLIEVALSIIALGLGAWLTCLAIWRD